MPETSASKMRGFGQSFIDPTNRHIAGIAMRAAKTAPATKAIAYPAKIEIRTARPPAIVGCALTVRGKVTMTSSAKPTNGSEASASNLAAQRPSLRLPVIPEKTQRQTSERSRLPNKRAADVILKPIPTSSADNAREPPRLAFIQYVGLAPPTKNPPPSVVDF